MTGKRESSLTLRSKISRVRLLSSFFTGESDSSLT